MRVIIQPDYAALSVWAAEYVASRINAANPTPEKPFVHGLRVRYLMGAAQDSIAQDSVPLLGPLGMENQALDSTKQQEMPENARKMQSERI